VLLIVILIVLSVLFGGFQKGTMAGSLGHSCASCTSAPALPPGAARLHDREQFGQIEAVAYPLWRARQAPIPPQVQSWPRA